MHIEIVDGLPFVSLELSYGGKKTNLKRVLLDTGSYSTIVSSDRLHDIGLVYEPDDKIRQIRGVGATEFVFTKSLERIVIDQHVITDISVEAGSLDYGFELDGILGMDILVNATAIIDLKHMELKVT
jgi:hypothetical protein